MGAALPELRYAPPLKWYQKRRFQRWLWVGFALAISPFLIVGGWLAVEEIHEAWLTRQNRLAIAACEAYVPPVEQVVFELQGRTITRLLPAKPWVEWWTPAQCNPTVFLHGLTDRAPNHFVPARQLVAVDIDPRLMASYDGRTLLDRRVLSFNPTQVWSVSTSRSIGSSFESTRLVILPEDEDRIRVFAGRALSDDPSRFSFDVEYNENRQTVHGVLQGNIVVMEPQSGEVISRPGWSPSVFWIPQGATAEQVSRTRAAADSAGQPGLTSWPLPPWWVVPPSP